VSQRRLALATAQAACETQLAATNFTSERDAADARMAATGQDELRGRIRSHEHALAAARGTLTEPELQDLAEELVDTEESADALAAAEAHRDNALAHRDRLTTTQRQATQLVGQARDAHEATSAVAERYEIVRRLAATVHGEIPNTKRMKLESYVLAAELEEIVKAANGRLRHMSGGRYLLEHSDALSYRNAQSGLGVTVLDLHTGVSRATHSLSGGETFLASLALALGLAEVVTSRAGGITLDTLFIDEGFGSLDAQTLEIAMATLDSLRSGGRTVGLISHVEAMKEQIPAKLAIEVADGGWSVIRQ
jgi:DNA repair protein SbcC/Rad50